MLASAFNGIRRILKFRPWSIVDLASVAYFSADSGTALSAA
jgi:hypothetical protein